jgi:hypothetical protein
MTLDSIRVGLFAPSLLAVTLAGPAPASTPRTAPIVASAALVAWDDDLEDYYEELAERRQEYLEDLAERREDALEDFYDDDHRRFRRHRAYRPPFAPPPAYGVPGPAYGLGGYGYGRPYLPSPVLPRHGLGAPLGLGYGPPPGYGGYGFRGPVPYGYGFGPRGGIDIPFGLGLGGLSIRW